MFYPKKESQIYRIFFSPKNFSIFWSKSLRKIVEKKHWMESSIFQQSIVIVIFISLNQKKPYLPAIQNFLQ